MINTSMTNFLSLPNMPQPAYTPCQAEEEIPVVHNQSMMPCWQHTPQTDAFEDYENTYEAFLEEQASLSGRNLNLNCLPGAFGSSNLLEAPISHNRFMFDLSLPSAQFQQGHMSIGGNLMNDTYGNSAGLTTFPTFASENNNLKIPHTVQATDGECNALLPSSRIVVPKGGLSEIDDRPQSSASGTIYVR
jgi:hypothetical protein